MAIRRQSRVATGAAQLNYGVTEHVILDAEAGGRQTIIGGNVNKLPFSLIAHPSVTAIAGLRGKRIGVSSLRAGSSSLVMKLLAGHGLRWPDDYELVSSIAQILALRELTLENQRLADQARLAMGMISAEEIERKRLEATEPGITQVNWGPDGSVLLDESLLDDGAFIPEWSKSKRTH